MAVEQVTAQMTTRPPRVAVVVPTDDDWSFWFRTAIHAATHRWGGSNFAVLPSRDGTVDPALRRLVVAYDPDHVVSLLPTVADIERLTPGFVERRVPEGMDVDAALVQSRDDTIPVPGLDDARDQVASWCTPHRMSSGAEGDERETTTHLLVVSDDDRDICALSLLGRQHLPGSLSAPATWGGMVGAMVASRVGAIDAPLPGTEPAPVDAAVKRWLLGPHETAAAVPFELCWFPDLSLSVRPQDQPTAWDATSVGVSRIETGIVRTMTLVLGDQVEDLAMAVMADRTYGAAAFLPTDWIKDITDGGLWSLRSQLKSAQRRATTIRLASVTVGQDELFDFAQVLDLEVEQSSTNGILTTRRRDAAVRSGYLAVEDGFDKRVPLAVRVATSGSRELAVPPPAPVIDHPDLHGRDFTWQVDLRLQNSHMPPGRGITGGRLLAEGSSRWDTLVRSGTSGLTYSSGRLGLVRPGESVDSRLAQPLLRDLGLIDWLRERADHCGRQLQYSAAGRNVETLAQLMGGRDEVERLFVGPLTPFIEAFVREGRSTDQAYPERDGVQLDGRGYLTFTDALSHIGGSMAASAVRHEMDQLADRRLLTRGMILQCPECRTAGFVALDHVQHMNTCRHCLRQFPLAQDTWKHPLEEPSWYYSLHGAAREVVEQRGHLVFLLRDHLRSGARRYADVSEVEVKEGVAPIAEADLMAHVDGQLVVAEVKSNARLGASGSELEEAARKRVLLAHLFRCDEILLATSSTDEWSSSSVEALRAAREELMERGSMPRIRTISALGTAPRDRVVERSA